MLQKISGFFIAISCIHLMNVFCTPIYANDEIKVIFQSDCTSKSSATVKRIIKTEKKEGRVRFEKEPRGIFLNISGKSQVLYRNLEWPADFSNGELSFDFKFNFDLEKDDRVSTLLRNQILATVKIQDTGELTVYWVKEGYLVVMFKDLQGEQVQALRAHCVPVKNKVNSFKLIWENGILLLINGDVAAGVRPEKPWCGFQTEKKRQAVLSVGAEKTASVVNCFSISDISLTQNIVPPKSKSAIQHKIDISNVPENLKKYYLPVDKYLSYPDYPMDKNPVVKLSSDPIQRERLVYVTPHAFKTIDQAREGIKFLKDQGFTAVITEYSRYLLRDEGCGQNKEHHVLRTQPFEELIRTNKLGAQAAHENGMKYYQHLTYNMLHDELAAMHPEWLVKNLITGKIEKNRYRTFAACQNNDEFYKFWSKRFERLMKETKSDGAMVDEIQLYSFMECGCDECMRKFKEDTGLELPKDRKKWLLDITDPVYKKWVIWRKNKILARRNDVTALVKKCNPDGIVLVYSANPSDNAVKMQYGGMRPDEMNVYAQSIGDESEPPMSKGYGHLTHYYLHSVIYEMKFNRAIAKPTSTGYWTLFYGTRAGSQQQPGWNVRAWLLSLTMGSRWWNLQYYPWMQRSQLAWTKRHEALFPNLSTYTNISIPVSASSQTWVPKVKGHPENIVSFSSLCTAMQDSHVPHRLITEQDLEKGQYIADTDLLLAMNLTAMSDDTIKSIKQFVEQGGTVVLSGESSMYDALGNKREDFALSDLIGAHYDNSEEFSDLLVVEKTNDVTGNFTGKLRTAYGFVKIKKIAPDVKISGYILDSENKSFPGILSRKYGKGKVVYFAGYPDARYFIGHGYSHNRIDVNKFWQDKRNPQHRLLLSSMVQKLLPGMTLEVENLPRRVYADVYRQDTPEIKGYQVHLLNLLDTKLQSGFIDPPPPLVFPSVKENLPDPTKPIEIKVKCNAVKGVFMITPDFDEIVQLPFTKINGLTCVKLPKFYRYAMLYFVEDGTDVIAKIANGKISDSIPPAKSIGEVGQDYPPVGKYNPKDVVFFADSPNFRGGHLDARPWVWPIIPRYVVGKGGGEDIVTFTFDLKKVDKHLIIEVCAKDNNCSVKAPITLKLNGKPLPWKNEYPYNKWAVKKITLSEELLKVGKNTLEFENHGQGPLLQAPWFGINFIRISR